MSSNYQPLIPATLAFNEQGVPLSAVYGDVYHPVWGALEQAERVFLRGNRLPQRWRARKSFTVCETGFGLGHNFLALWQAWRSDPARADCLHVVSFEAHPFKREDLARLLKRLPESEQALARQLVEAWPALLPGLHRLEFEGGRLTLTLVFGAVEKLARQVDARADAFFLDGFAPRVNPQMWSRSLFGQLVRIANAGATAATWCCAGAVRRALGDAGFLVSKVPGYGGKREMTVATLRSGLGRPLAEPGRPASIMVVGGGIAAAGVAQALTLRGHHVTVLDPVFAAGLGASHRGHLAAGLSPVISRGDDIRARLIRAGVSRSLQRWQGLPEPARPWRCGTLEVPATAAEGVERRRALADLAFPSEWAAWLDKAQASQVAGFGLRQGALWFRDGQRVQPERLLEALFSLPEVYCIAKPAAQLRQNDNGDWMALDTRGAQVATANHVVLANAGAVAGLLHTLSQPLGLAKLTAMRHIAGQIAYFAEGKAARARAIVAGNGYWLPAVQGLCTAGSTYRPDARTSQLSKEGFAEVTDKAGALLGLSPNDLGNRPNEKEGWAGWRAAVADRLPVIGRIDGTKGLWLASGYGSRGFTWSALAGDVIAAQLCAEPAILERELLRKIAPR